MLHLRDAFLGLLMIVILLVSCSPRDVLGDLLTYLVRSGQINVRLDLASLFLVWRPGKSVPVPELVAELLSSGYHWYTAVFLIPGSSSFGMC